MLERIVIHLSELLNSRTPATPYFQPSALNYQLSTLLSHVFLVKNCKKQKTSVERTLAFSRLFTIFEANFI